MMTAEPDLSNNPIDISDTNTWKVLIVDDVMDNIAIAKVVLESQGADVQIAKNGIEGFEVMDTFDTNLILLDLSMPEMNGWEMHEKLRENPDTASIVVIALTAHAMQGDKEKVMAAGFDGYISKPFSVSALTNDIKTILQSVDSKE